MTATAPDPPQFPAGPFVAEQTADPRRRASAIDALRAVPSALRDALAGLDDDQLNVTYRNWSIRQIVHHLADSHVNAFVRCKLALTEDQPTIKPYDESRWSLLADARHAPVEPSLQILDGVHARWIPLLQPLTNDEWMRAYYHPGDREVVPLWRVVEAYAWHARHHTAQIAWVKTHKLGASRRP